MLSEFYTLNGKSREEKTTTSNNKDGLIHEILRSNSTEENLTSDVKCEIKDRNELSPLKGNHNDEVELRLAAEKRLDETTLRMKLMEEGLEAARAVSEKTGYENGYAEGLIQGEQVQTKQLQRLRDLTESIKSALGEQIVGLEDLIVEIVFESVCKIVGNACIERNAVIAMVREAISKVSGREIVAIRVSPEDLSFLTKNKQLLLEGAEAHEPFNVVGDDRVMLGGCLVETSGGTLDARLEIQIQALRESLLAARRSLPE